MREKPDRRLIGPQPRSTPATGRLLPAHRRELPPDLLRQASHRLGVIALLAACLWIIGTVLYHYVDRVIGAGDMRWMSLQPSDAMVALGAALSLALFFYTRREGRDPKFILNLGLAYMVVTAFIAGLIIHSDTPAFHQSVEPQIGWVGVLVLLFAAVLPNRPLKVFWTGVVAAMMMPIAMLIARARGLWNFEHAGTAWIMHYPDLLIVGIATVISRVVSSLGQQVAKAREMGSYELGELLGRGGMGEVYVATHRMLARPAAIKLIRAETLAVAHGGGPTMAAARFQREARAAANLRSPHTVELYDFGVTDEGTLYFAMELLDGVDLETLVRETGPLPAARVIHVLRQVCESLEEAHAQGLVHRDIKPANIHLGRLGLVPDFVKVLDFGLVTAASSHTDDLPVLSTATGTVPGTPAYMAPEMALRETIDGRADLYSLGCVAYYLLTGQLVFEGGSGLQTIVRRLHDDPVPPSQRTELPIPPALEHLVLACLARDRDRRPPSAAALRDDLDAIEGERWTEQEAEAWWKLNKVRSTKGEVQSTKERVRTALNEARRADQPETTHLA